MYFFILSFIFVQDGKDVGFGSLAIVCMGRYLCGRVAEE
jgi:hypothetical protein